MNIALPKIGKVVPVHSRAVTSSHFGVGFEKLDRNVFDPEKAYDKVAALGVKKIRLQSGWQRTETEKGCYHFEWLDSIVDNLVSRGLEPWICLCYGNALYTKEAQTSFGAVGYGPMRTKKERDAWVKYVTACVKRYADRVEWFEIWNEPEWCWRPVVSGKEYGEFSILTAKAIRKAAPKAKIMGACICGFYPNWIHDCFETACLDYYDAVTYHCYYPDDDWVAGQVRFLKAAIDQYRPGLPVIQGETGCQSREGGAGAMKILAWSEDKQARYLARSAFLHLSLGALFTSYFSSLDMIEALNGTVGNVASYLDYGYFGLLRADFDENGRASGEYTPKPSYYTYQTIASVFRDSPEVCELPIKSTDRYRQPNPRLCLIDDDRLYMQKSIGFRRKNGSCALVYWHPSQLIRETYESSLSLETCLAGKARIVDLLTGDVYDIPDERIEDHNGARLFRNIPLADYPIALTFGDFFSFKSKKTKQ